MSTTTRISKFRVNPLSENKLSKGGHRYAASLIFADTFGDTNTVRLTEGQLKELLLPFGVQPTPEGFNAFGVMMNATSGAGNLAEVEVLVHKKGDKYIDLLTGEEKEYKGSTTPGHEGEDWTEVKVLSIMPSAPLGAKLLDVASTKLVAGWSNWTAASWEVPATPAVV